MGYVRGLIIADILRAATELDPAVGAEARERVPTLASKMSWVPIQETTAMHDLLLLRCGDAEMLALFRRNLVHANASPILAPLAKAASALLGKEPASHLRWIPPAWSMVTRGLGKASFHSGDDRAAIRIAGAPAIAVSSRGWRASLCCSFAAVVADLGYEVASSAETAGDVVTVNVRWDARAAKALADDHRFARI